MYCGTDTSLNWYPVNSKSSQVRVFRVHLWSERWTPKPYFGGINIANKVFGSERIVTIVIGRLLVKCEENIKISCIFKC